MKKSNNFKLLLPTLLLFFLLTSIPIATATTTYKSEFTAFSINSTSATSTGLDASSNPLLTVAPSAALAWSSTAGICLVPSCVGGTSGAVQDGYTVNLLVAASSCATALTWPQSLFTTADTQTTTSGTATGSIYASSATGTYCYALAHPNQSFGTGASQNIYTPSNSTDSNKVILVIQVLVHTPPTGPQSLDFILTENSPNSQACTTASPCPLGSTDTGEFAASYTITANVALTSVKVQGGLNGAPTFAFVSVTCVGSAVSITKGTTVAISSGTCAGASLTWMNVAGNVFTLSFASMNAGDHHTLALTFDWASSSTGTYYITGQWSASCTSDEFGTTTTLAADPTTAPVTVS